MSDSSRCADTWRRLAREMGGDDYAPPAAVLDAGNVIPFVEPSTLPEAARRLAAHTRAGGLVVCGFGFDPEHLPRGAPVVPLAAYVEACGAAGLVLQDRYAGWAGEVFTGPEGGYSVSVHRRD